MLIVIHSQRVADVLSYFVAQWADTCEKLGDNSITGIVQRKVKRK